MSKVKKFFNTAGPVNRPMHYKIDPLHRWDLEAIQHLIDSEKYFVLHAPRQSGKTSTLLAMRDHINEQGEDLAIYINVETAQVARNDIEKGIKIILAQLGYEVEKTTGEETHKEKLLQIFVEKGGGNALLAGIQYLSDTLNKPLILFIDEIDALIGDTLVSVLRQLRTGYNDRPEHFAKSIVLCGLVDVKDYKIHQSNGEIITGGSCFNIKAKPIRMENFTKEDILALYLEHTKETGQVFEEGIIDLAWHYTAGQPWLVNALGYEVTYEMGENRDVSKPITLQSFKKAKERLILSRATHLDQLADKLKEDRVRRVIEPMMLGSKSDASRDDKIYCTDLGLVRNTSEGFVVSNAIYKEVIPRELSNSAQDNFLSLYKIPEWVKEDESIHVEKLMCLFVEFWRENSEIWAKDMSGYLEAAPHLIFQGFLQRVANGHGTIEREYALGNGRVDLLLEWKGPHRTQKIIFELKIRSEHQPNLEKIKDKAMIQTAEYAKKCNPESLHVLIFDRREGIEWSKKVFNEVVEYEGYKIKIWGM